MSKIVAVKSRGSVANEIVVNFVGRPFTKVALDPETSLIWLELIERELGQS